ncbi:MAG TPA: hypothetical protein VKX39_08375 [Bryobacteraceae bacterium]|nr:hypothetical protein [Bryobacteraceae bacterium]
MKQARAILWAQWRSLRHSTRLGRAPDATGVVAGGLAALWYGLWLAASALTSRFLADADRDTIAEALPLGLGLVLLYWQAVPLLMAASGAALDLRKLRPYPIPTRQLFFIEVALRSTSAPEMSIVLGGAAVGISINPRLAPAGIAAIPLFAAFNLLLALGIRDVMARLFARRRWREAAVLAFVALMTTIQLAAKNPQISKALQPYLDRLVWEKWPWEAAARAIEGHETAFTHLLAWCAAAGVFGFWQFRRTLAFDQAEEVSQTRKRVHFSLPLPDPIAALLEKEIRVLARSPRFRMMFFMGFSFGLAVWLPSALGRPGLARGFIGANYLTMVSIYSLLLLNEVCMFNAFGFDRSAAQMYFLAPVALPRVLMGKNLAALFFILLEIAAVTAACGLLRVPINSRKIGEALSVVAVTALFQLAAGNILSVRQARGVDPDASLRQGATGRSAAARLAVLPLSFVPAALAYLGRFAFDSELAFFAVLAFEAVAGLAVYRIALESASGFAEAQKETMVAALCAGTGPIAG